MSERRASSTAGSRAAAIALVAALALTATATVTAPRPAFAQSEDSGGDDYDTASQAWNGMSTFTAVARGLGLTVEEVEDVDWDELGAEDILFLLYPTRRLEPGHVAAFVRNGGHVLVADDFGDSSEALGRLGMLRGRAIGVSASEFYRGLQYVPIARPLVKNHPLAERVDKLATNHPSILTDVTGPEVIFGFSDSEGVVVAGQLGNGRFIVCSDPSVFINRMLQFEGNVEFAFNALRYLKREGLSRRLVILSGDFSMYGEPTSRLDDGTMTGSMANMMGDFNRWLDERNDYLLTEPGMRAAAIILGAIIGLLMLLSLPLARRKRMEGEWTSAKTAGITPDDFEQIVSRYDHVGLVGRRKRTNNYILPATVLRDAVFAVLTRVTDVPDMHNATYSEIAEAITHARGQMATTAYRRMHKRLASLPSRLQAASPWSTSFMSRRDFERLNEDAVELYLALGEEAG